MKKALKLVLSLLVTLLFSWIAFRNTTWETQWQSLRSAHYVWVLPYFLVLTGIHLCRSLRWGYLLQGLERIPFRKVNEASAIGFMMLLILPFRLGEFARPFLIAQRSSVRRSTAMTTVVLERIVDGITIALLLRLLLFFLPAEPGKEKIVLAVKVGANAMFLVFGGGLAFLLFALWQKDRAVRLIRALAGGIAPKVADKVAEIVDAFVGAMTRLPGPRAVFGFFFFTAGYWALNGYGMHILSNAFECQNAAAQAACEPLSLTVYQSYVVLCVLVVGLMIPAAPGMMGTFQTATMVGLGLFLPSSVVNSLGLAYANVMWFCQTVQQVGFGILWMAIAQVSFKEITGKLGAGADADSPTASAPATE